MLMAAAISALIHAVLSFLFGRKSSSIILKLHGEMAARMLFDA
tara:strand:- start:74 stop:202 length:129 start_codon:yes stop_codon:yes gene_type:complete